MTRTALSRGILLGAALAATGCATTPPDKDPVQIKLNDLDARLQRIERVLANQSLLDLANELEAARSDVRSLHNDVDLLSNDLAAARKQERDLDRRLKVLELRGTAVTGPAASGAGLTGGSAAAAGGPGEALGGTAPASAAASTPGSSAIAGPGAASGLPVADGGDKANYQAAFGLLKDSRYDEAIAAFQQFLRAFPDSSLADNAQYWLGEAYYVNHNFVAALAAFQGVIDRYPESRKVGDAMLKIGYCDYELKQWDLAKQVLADVVAKYADTPAGNLAKQRLDKIAAEGH